MESPLPAAGFPTPRWSSVGNFVRVCLGWFIALLALRAYEFMLVDTTHRLPAGTGGAVLRGTLADLQLVLVVGALLAIPVLAVARWYPVFASRMHRALLTLLTLAGVALAQYFAVTFVPLGADLFGYSWADVSSTVMSSAGISVASVAAYALLGAGTWVVTGLALRIAAPRAVSAAFAAAAVVACVAPSTLTPGRIAFGSDATWFLAQNKTYHLGSRAAAHFGIMPSGRSGPPPTGFPLLREASHDDVLGPLLRTAPARPNIVLIVIEGLGRDFVGPGAAYGGFTPFLDSLAARSLFWENFLAVSGRTFGSMPALLGSLPFGAAGFMGLRTEMPPHLTLMRLLGERGYRTSYFTGTDGHFDFIDTFMERQGVQQFVDQSAFGPAYELQPAGVNGFTWGYPDDALFRRSLELIGTGDPRPRLDVYLTVTTHEPFVPPRASEYAAEFERRLATLQITPDRGAEIRAYANIFATLLYSDDAVRQFLATYARRPDYARTIFIITGDHRLIPIPPAERIDRYRVPFIIHSPLVKAPRRFASVSSHLDVTPSLLALLGTRYGMSFPDSVAWLGTGIDTASGFRNVHALALMRAKNTMDEYLDGMHLLSGGEVFRVTDRLGLFQIHDDTIRDRLAGALERFRAINRYVTEAPRLYPLSAADSAALIANAREDSVFRQLKLGRKTPTEVFFVARDLAIDGQYEAARLIARRLLRDGPNFHDARVLLARTYGWNSLYDDARAILDDLRRRAPDYVDGYVASTDLERWAGQPARSLSIAESALSRFPGNAELLERRNRARDAVAATAAAARPRR